MVSVLLKYIPVLFCLLLISCKAEKRPVQASVQGLLILMEEKYQPAEISILKEHLVGSPKQTSRSQNLWLVQLQLSENQLDELMKQLTKLDAVVSVSKPTTEKATNTSNQNKKKAKPIKN